MFGMFRKTSAPAPAKDKAADKTKAKPKESSPRTTLERRVMGGMNESNRAALEAAGMKKGGKVKKPGYKKGGMCR